MPFFSSHILQFFCLLNQDQEENNAGDFYVGWLVLFSNFLFVCWSGGWEIYHFISVISKIALVTLERLILLHLYG